MKNKLLILVMVLLSIINLSGAENKILPQSYYDIKGKLHWYTGEGGPANSRNAEKRKKYADTYMQLVDIFSQYYTNGNVEKKEMIFEYGDIITYQNGLISVIKNVYGEAKYKQYRDLLFDFEVRKECSYLQKRERWDYQTAYQLAYVTQISFSLNWFIGGGDLKKGEKKLKELMDKGVYSISTIIGYFQSIWYQDRKSNKVIEWYEKYKDSIPDDALMRSKFATDIFVNYLFFHYKANGKESRGKQLQQELKDRIMALQAKGMKYKYIE